jgi:serine/threonine protein kinase
MKNILEVLKYLSEKGISHRDLKLDNIMISRDLSIKLIDFGFSIKGNQMVNDFCGTPHYISPEILSKGGYFP